MKLLAASFALSFAVAALGTDDTQKLPSRDPVVVIPLLKKLEGRPNVQQVEEILGRHDREAGSGRCIFIYVLRDQSEIWANTGDCQHLGWITRVRRGRNDEMIFRATEWPQPVGTIRAGDADGPVVSDHRVIIPRTQIEFTLPDRWEVLPGETVHIGDLELKRTESADAEWDHAFAAVANAALPFSHCLGHFGQEGWDDQGGSFADLQFRVYRVEWTEHYFDQLSERALKAGQRFSEKAAIEKAIDSDWRVAIVSFPVWYGDYGGIAKVAFFERRIDATALIFVFMYSGYPARQERDIHSIISSVKAGGQRLGRH